MPGVFSRFFFICILLLSANTLLFAQSVPLGLADFNDYYRRSQLINATDSDVSFTVRPLFNPKHNIIFYSDTLGKYSKIKKPHFLNILPKVELQLLPVELYTQYNTHHPYGWNDGPMIPSKGLQAIISPGIWAKYGPLTIQLKPEIVTAANTQFNTFNPNQYDVLFARYYDIYNKIDAPVRFGYDSYNKIYWGQSSIRLNYKKMSLGVSTENLWWGPGIRNSLLMSNTAPGFAHITLNTTQPLKTPLGSIEAQIIAGKPRDTKYGPLQPDHYYFGSNLYVPKPDDRRYLSGVIITWQPKFLKGLFLGFDQVSQRYSKDMSGIGDYLPLFPLSQKANAPDNSFNRPDRLSSWFMRWVLPKEHAEFYFEYGHYNYAVGAIQTSLSPSNSRAYTFGVRKLLPFKARLDENIMIGFELTQLQGTSLDKVMQGKAWYVSDYVRQGYTNRGEVIGAGIGPGSNLQSLNISWVKGLKKIGLQVERYVHNNDYYLYAFLDSKDYTRHWVDLSASLNGVWDYKNLVFQAGIHAIQSLNYQWALKGNTANDITFANQSFTYNFQFQAGLAYRFTKF
jgi:hypothetical protein